MTPTDPGDAVRAVRRLLEKLEALEVRCVIGGSLASSTWGFPRATRDVDLVAELDPETVERFVEALGDAVYVDVGAARDAVRRYGFFNVIDLETVVKIDVFVPGTDPGMREQLERRRMHPISISSSPSASAPGSPSPTSYEPLPLLSPEDTILQKLRWFRLGGEKSESQWADVVGVIRVQSEGIDQAYLGRTADAMGLGDLLEKARRES